MVQRILPTLCFVYTLVPIVDTQMYLPSSRVKALKEALDLMEARAIAAERSTQSLDAQRKSALAEKNKLQKQVSFLSIQYNLTSVSAYIHS